jgi:hypothetical protein
MYPGICHTGKTPAHADSAATPFSTLPSNNTSATTPLCRADQARHHQHRQLFEQAGINICKSFASIDKNLFLLIFKFV